MNLHVCVLVALVFLVGLVLSVGLRHTGVVPALACTLVLASLGSLAWGSR